MKVLVSLLIFLFFNLSLFSQDNDTINEIRKHYELFEYKLVISKTKTILLNQDKYSSAVLIDLLSLKSASHFAIGEIENTRKTIVLILKLDNKFKFSSKEYSPKLINYFETIKKEVFDILILNEENNKKKIKHSPQKEKPIISNHLDKSGIIKSLLLPGLGHLHNENNVKGWILTTTSTLTFSSMCYFIFKTNAKENDYLSVTNPNAIKKNYTEYNNSYKIRNLLIASYIAVWLFSQFDLLFLSENNEFYQMRDNVQIQQVNKNNFTFSLKIPL